MNLLLTTHLPHIDDVRSIERDYQTNPLLKSDVEWYRMLFSIRGIKEYYAQKVQAMLSPKKENIETEEHQHIEETDDEWITYNEMLKRFDFNGKTMVKDANWRKKHDFYPCKQDGKVCALRINVPLLKRWLNGEKK